MTKHEHMNQLVSILKQYWVDANLLSYELWYLRSTRGRLYMTCPDNYANSKERINHKANIAAYEMCFEIWKLIKWYFQDQPENVQRYLIQHWDMLRDWEVE